jgi:hypothetical protein
MASPVLSLLTPICIIILPFFILKAKGINVTMEEYISVLKTVASTNAIGKIFTHFHAVPNDQKVYLIISAAFYVISVYQSILSCIRFYKNMKKIHNSLTLLKNYIENTESNVQCFLKHTDNLQSYKVFNDITRENIKILSEFKEKLQTIRGKEFSLSNIGQIGKMLKYFYEFYFDKKLHAGFMYSFGYYGYTENLSGLLKNMKEKKISFANFKFEKDVEMNEMKEKNEKNEKKKKKEKKEKKNKKSEKENKKSIIFKNLYYGALMNKNPIKNTVDLSKTIVITGPNASGKTTVLKSALINLILSQQIGCGFYEGAELSPVKYIHCYLNIPDTSGRDSLFQAEARRCKEIIDIINSTKDGEEQHFCVFDELYSGTNPEEATTSSLAFMEYLVKFKNVKCILTTHFTKVCKKLKKNKCIENYCMETIHKNDNFSYTYLLKRGISEVRGGFKVLQDMKYPEEILTKCPQ